VWEYGNTGDEASGGDGREEKTLHERETLTVYLLTGVRKNPDQQG